MMAPQAPKPRCASPRDDAAALAKLGGSGVVMKFIAVAASAERRHLAREAATPAR